MHLHPQIQTPNAFPDVYLLSNYRCIILRGLVRICNPGKPSIFCRVKISLFNQSQSPMVSIVDMYILLSLKILGWGDKALSATPITRSLMLTEVLKFKSYLCIHVVLSILLHHKI